MSGSAAVNAEGWMRERQRRARIKVMSGSWCEGISATSRRSTWRRRNPRGNRAWTTAKPRRRSHGLSHGEKALRAGRRRVALRATEAARRRQRREGTKHRRDVSAVREGNSLKGEPWTWQWGEINPRADWRSKPSRACETPRTETQRELGFPLHGRRLVMSRRGTATPRKAQSLETAIADVKRRTL